MARTPHPVSRRRRLLAGLGVYAALLAASHLVEHLRASDDAADTPSVEVALTDDSGPINGRTQRIATLEWSSKTGDPGPEPGDAHHENPQRLPVILLHGSPGEGSNFTRLGPVLSARGYRTIAPDLPGFGGSTSVVPSYSVLAHAYALEQCMNAWGIDRAHIVGWSQGGGVALHLADLVPDRVATLTLLGSVGEQRTEGSGSYWFEHAKYGLGYAGLVVGGELVPHFGVLGSHAERRAFIRNFWDSDQRPLRRLMTGLETPTLILHGDRDFLTPLWAARRHHQLLRQSKLVIFDGSHFVPILQAEEAAARMDRFFSHNAAPAGERAGPFYRELIDLSPPATTLGARLDRMVGWALPVVPWWVLGAALWLLAWRRPERAAGLGGFLVAMLWADTGVVCAVLLAGQAARVVFAARGPRTAPDGGWRAELARGRAGLLCTTRLQPWRRDEAVRAARGAGRLDGPAMLGALAGAVLWTALAFFPALIAASIIRGALGDSLPAFACMIVGGVLAARLGVFASTWTGRQRLKATLRRAHKHEFWPGWAYYAPLVPWLAWHGARHGGVMSCTRVNPVIGAGGGVVGESKHEILDGLAGVGDGLLGAVFIEPGDPAGRFDQLRRAMGSGALPAEYPIVLKPDAGQRGYAVRIARSDDDARDYLARMPRPVVAQTYHPGPIELGAMWVRDPDAPPGRVGRVFSLTLKAFPDLIGDGRHTIEQLVYLHTRFRCQADMLLQRFADRRLEVLGEGEPLRLTRVGNHSQGAIFLDAGEHITPELEAWVDGAAAAFSAPLPDGVNLPAGDNGLDFGRFDLRARSIEDVRAARGLAIIELNGTAAESTTIYDPDRSLWWSWGVLLRHWSLLYRLGGRRARMGVPAMGPLELWRAWREFESDRPDVKVGV